MYTLLALVMLVRGFIDALMMRSQQALAAGGAQGYLPPEHYDQIFSAHGTIMIFFVGHAVRDRADELRRAAAARRARRRLPGAELGELLADRLGRAAGQRLAVRRRVRAHRLAGLSAAVGARLLARRRRRLLPLGAADLRRRHPDDRHQLHHHDPEAARAGHGLRPHADLLLDGAGLEPADRRRLSDPDRDLRDAAARPLPRLPLLHQRRRRQRDDVRQPDLGVGPSRGLHPGPAGLRRLLRGDRDLLGQAAVRLPLDGRRHARHLRAVLHGVAAPLLHHGRRRRRQRLLRRHDHRSSPCRPA